MVRNVGNGPDYKRYTAKISSYCRKRYFKVGENFNYTHSHENTLTFRDDILLGNIPPLITTLVEAIPTMPVYDEANLNGFGGSSSEFNGANSLNGIGVNSVLTNWVDVDRTFGNVFGELQLIKNSTHNLRYRTSLSYDKTVARDYTWQPAFYFGKFFSKDVAQLSDNWYIPTQLLKIPLTMILHSVSILFRLCGAIVSAKIIRVIRTATATGFTTPYLPVISNGETTKQRVMNIHRH